MTLIIAARTKKDIIVASDTLATVKMNGVNLHNEIVEKIYQPNPETALLIAGNIEKSKLAFIRAFTSDNRLERDVRRLHALFVYRIHELPLHLGPEESIQVCFVGFSKGETIIKVMTWRYGQSPRSGACPLYFIGGFTSPSYRAEALMLERGVKNYPSKNKLKKIVTETIKQCIEEFKDGDGGERLGGKPDIRVLSSK